MQSLGTTVSDGIFYELFMDNSILKPRMMRHFT